ncbi:hypothetical protein VOLCADRAFT_103740 [Volvox carteri f. nagariensis]|uniref:Uncharacterized protein n=1 Tax=Volvox carteri f. nagariensis TaxID=3068 RepID=D8TN86_VOLCA|nr:uncharacterized protein VOLCADRAFT_103740 [Volvox carteri f. nagariensis]EFJ51098.1 hypothetical protein VOLCADRAFT_103740 [Volvox carteri f. nagariensis]|eukprot:XP_002948110.1 hypothetical protein VOLCADRAFT_103740 [Volvox carteri f. nagariensis]
MNNVPETARICCITHDAAAREPLLHDAAGKTLVRGEHAVRSRLQHLNSAARSSSRPISPQPSGGPSAGFADLGMGMVEAASGSSGSGSSPVLHISAPLVALEGYGPEFGRVTLLDTPGPNEAGEEQLKHQVERLLEGVDCVLYLLDYTKLKTAEEECLFRRLRAINPQLVDASETSEGLDPEEVRNYVADLVTRQLGGAATSATTTTAGTAPLPAASGGSGSLPTAASVSPAASARIGSSGSGSVAEGIHAGVANAAAAAAAAQQQQQPFRLHPDQVLLLSARNALMARLVLSGRASPEAAKRFHRLAFGAFGGGGFGSFGTRGAAAGPSREQVRAAAGCLLEGSGILELESRVLTFLAAHAGSVKLLATADDLTRLLAQVRNVALACRSCLHRNVTALQDQAEGLRMELEEATAAFEEVRSRTDAVQAEVVSEIKAHLNTLRRRLFTHIVQTLDTDARAPAPAAAAGTQPPTSRWHRVREKFLSMFTSPSSTMPPQPHPAGPSLVPEARSRSRGELQALLLDLHDDLMGQIHSEVYDFWGVLEACAASRHSELLSALNGHLAALSRRVEGAVSEALGVQLAAADLRLRPPSAEQLHSDVQGLIEKGIRESTEKHIRVGARTTTERVFQQPQGPPSLCRWGGYWVEVPRTRTVVETYTATVYSLRPDEIANHFIGLVDGAVTASEQALGAYVGTMVERQLAAAKERIRDYGDRYLSVMSAALAASSRGAECRSCALASVESYLTRLDNLLARAEAAQRDAEAAVPGGATGLMDEIEVYDDVYDEGAYIREDPKTQQVEQGLDEQIAQAVATDRVWRKAHGQEEELKVEPQSAVSQLPEAGKDKEVAEATGPLVAMQTWPTPFSSSSAASVPDIDDAAVTSEAVSASAHSEHDIECGDGGDGGGFTVLMDAAQPELAAAMPGAIAESGNCASDAQLVSDHAVLPAAAVDKQQTQEQQQEQDSVALPPHQATSGPSAAIGPSQAASALPSGSSACASLSYSAMPFDYSRAFLEAMSSSEMAPGSKLDEELTTIPLTNGCAGAIRSADDAAPTASHGTSTPFSGGSEDWQLVGDEALDVADAASGNK